MPYELFQSKITRNYHFRLKARNGEIILASESYKSHAGAVNGIQSVRKNAKEENFERKLTKAGRWYFVLKAANGEPIGRSELFSFGSKSALKRSIQSVIKNAQDTTVLDLTVPEGQPKKKDIEELMGVQSTDLSETTENKNLQFVGILNNMEFMTVGQYLMKWDTRIHEANSKGEQLLVIKVPKGVTSEQYLSTIAKIEELLYNGCEKGENYKARP